MLVHTIPAAGARAGDGFCNVVPVVGHTAAHRKSVYARTNIIYILYFISAFAFTTTYHIYVYIYM